MSTRDVVTVRKEKDVSVGEAALTMAVGIIVERVSRLPVEDKQDLYELIKGLGVSQDPDEIGAIRVAIQEILDQEPSGVRDMEVSEARPEKLQKWVNFVAEQVRTHRQRAGWTQVELAEKSGLPQSHISRIESAKLSPSRMTLEKIAKAMSISLQLLDPSA